MPSLQPLFPTILPTSGDLLVSCPSLSTFHFRCIFTLPRWMPYGADSRIIWELYARKGHANPFGKVFFFLLKHKVFKKVMCRVVFTLESDVSMLVLSFPWLSNFFFFEDVFMMWRFLNKEPSLASLLSTSDLYIVFNYSDVSYIWQQQQQRFWLPSACPCRCISEAQATCTNWKNVL